MGGDALAAAAAGFRLPEADIAFRPRFPWWGGDLQTLHNRLLRRAETLTPWPSEPLTFPLEDGSGDRLLVSLHRNAGGAERPPVILIHGMTGCEDSSYIRASAGFFLRRGHPVLRLNLRGAGPSRALCRRHYNAGSWPDLLTLLAQLKDREAALMAEGCYLMGYSLGGSILLNALAAGGSGLGVRAAVAVSVPLDLKATQRQLMTARNRAYHAYLLRGLCQSQLARPQATAEVRATLATKVHSIYDYDDLVTAPAGGFAGADDYYARCAAGPRLGAIQSDTLAIHAADDPWIPAACYRAIDWPGLGAPVGLFLTATGGHVGFHEAGQAVPWHDRAAAAFFATR